MSRLGLHDGHRRRVAHQPRAAGLRYARRRVRVGQLLVLHVLRHVEQHGAGPTLTRHGERFTHRVGQLLHVLDQPAVLGDRLGDADDVGLLERVAPDHRARHLAGDRHQRRAVHVRGGDAGHQVGGARPRGGDAHAGAAAGACVAVGRVRRGLLVPHQHVPERRVLGQRVVERHDRAARVPEHDIDPLVQQGAAEDLGAGELLRHQTPHR